MTKANSELIRKNDALDVVETRVAGASGVITAVLATYIWQKVDEREHVLSAQSMLDALGAAHSLLNDARTAIDILVEPPSTKETGEA